MNQPQKIYLKDYTPPGFSIDAIELSFDLYEDFCRVQSHISFFKTGLDQDLFLDGEALELEQVLINDKPANFELTAQGIKILNVPQNFTLKISNKIKPHLNTALEGLYKSGTNFISQCEAQGFRHITYFMDRPDIMTKFTVHIEADKSLYPILLSNGDKVAEKNLENNRHKVTWIDPFKKPCYLFALVAGNFGILRDQFITKSGKKITLEIFSEKDSQERCIHAMESLKKAMKWDEERFGREYDLSTYMIVTTDDFNAGAMENKGLNIFNSKLIYANPKIATDTDYFDIESVIAHEYFHNWTGNRVTLRDWFHLSLKEGLTVFRDQEFSMDMSSRSLVRIDSVDHLRNLQFTEDSGPNAHPIRPASCYAVDNFFTSTIYEKGSEVIRMMQTMVGRPGFKKGMDLYFERHDGAAVIIEDFAKSISDANNQDWNQFKLWYSQAGTPHVKVKENFNHSEKTYTLELEQSCPLTVQEKEEKIEKTSFHIPLVIGLLSPNGKEYDLECEKCKSNSEGQNLIHLKEQKERFIFKNISHKPVLSINRQFSAPIQLDWEASYEDLLFLVKNDTDAFNRWESIQKIFLNTFSKLIYDYESNNSLKPSPILLEALKYIVTDATLDEGLKAKLLMPPSTERIAQNQAILQAPAILAARTAIENEVAETFEKDLLKIYHQLHGKNILSKDPKDFGRRHLKNLCLSYLGNLKQHQDLVWQQFINSQIMTDEEAAFWMLLNLKDVKREKAIESFYSKWKNETLVMNKWFALQASSYHPETFNTVQSLWNHPDFIKTNPNKVYSLVRTFGRNLISFHSGAGETYQFMANAIIELDKLNPQVATRIASSFDLWAKLPPVLKEKAGQSLQKIKEAGLSKNTFEIISKQLAPSLF